MKKLSGDDLTVTFPHDGDILCRHDGTIQDDRLLLEVRGAAHTGGSIRINGVPADAADGWFCARVPLEEGRQIICVSIERDGAVVEENLQVTVNLQSRRRYRFSIDDNIEFLADIGKNPAAYESLFDHWYLAFWRDLHREFGTKVHINIYFQNDARDFNLTQFPDTFREEWQENSDWLHLSFHAVQDQPARLYRNASYELMATHYEMVAEQIQRFAGPEVTGNVTTIHWAECPREALRAIRDRGIDTFIALPRRYGECTTGYYLDPETKARLAYRDAWMDTDEGFTFVCCDCVVNSLPLDDILPYIRRQASDPHTGEMLELLIHEQYFRKELPIYQPDIFDKVRQSVQWVTEQGYEPVFWADGFLGTPE
ncbi:MAG: hypothetical protein ACLFWB_11520 [Armatimonadota bacterium]